MSEILKKHFGKFVTISDDEFFFILNYFRVVHYKKKQNLLRKLAVRKPKMRT